MIATADETPLLPVVEAWLSMIGKADEHRDKQFGENAEFFHRLYTEKHDFVYDEACKNRGASREVAAPAWKMTFNKVAELVQLFGPHLYHKNPNRHVLPSKPGLPDELFQLQYPDPMQAQAVLQQRQFSLMADKATAGVLGAVLNYLPREFDLKRESLLAIDEGLIAGRGFLWHEMYSPPGSPDLWLPRTYFKSWRDCGIDPDAECVREATWCYLKCTAPYFDVEKEYGLEPGSLKKVAKGESANRQARMESDGRGDTSRRQGVSHDLITYYKVWSKRGMGHKLSAPPADKAFALGNENLQSTLDQFGDYCFVVVCEGVPYPLNLPPDIQNADIEPDVSEDPEAAQANREDLMRRVRWPVPFHLEEGGWPFTELDFHPVPNSLWPMAHLFPAIGELMFLDWAFSWLAGRIEKTGRTLIFAAGTLADEIERVMRKGKDLEIARLDQMHRNIKEFVECFTFPEVNKDVWEIIDRVMREFEKRTGLNDLLYGMAGKQMRSASEAQMREQAISTRPDDMADKVEDWQGKAARKEALMLRRMVPPQMVAPIFREDFQPELMLVGPATSWWGQKVYVPYDPDAPETGAAVEREYEYGIESGSVRKPNLERDQSNSDLAAQTYLPVLQAHYQATGDPGPLNGFTRIWAETHQMDPEPLMLPPLMMQPPAPVGPDGQPTQEPQPAGVM